MPTLTATLTTWLWLPVAVGLFLLPGWMVVRRVPTPLPIVAAFLASAAILFNLVLLLDAAHAPVHVGSVGIGLAAIAAALRWWKTKTAAVSSGRPEAARPRDAAEWLWLLPAVLALASIAARTLIDPLSGHDNSFRWDYLARLFLVQESLTNYPPVVATHFEFYSWCDGIPPLIPLLNFWIYAVSSSVAPELISVRVIGEALLLGALVFRYSRLLWGPAAGGAAVAALSSSSLALWSVAMSQETGLTAIALVAMLFFLTQHDRAPSRSALFWAAVAAGVGGLARDYTLAHLPLGAAVLIYRRQPARRVMIFVGIAAAICAPWYLRNWIRTGNPLYPHPLGGIFPGNAVHEETMDHIAGVYGFSAGQQSVALLAAAFAVLAGVLALLGMVGLCRLRRDRLVVMAGLGTTTLLWLWSVPYTAGGWIYSLRVLLPALALLAILAGWLGSLQGRASAMTILLLCLVAGDAARRSWIALLSPFAAPWSLSLRDWRFVHEGEKRLQANPLWNGLVGNAGTRKIVVDHPAHHMLVTKHGGTAVPLFSPVLNPTLGLESFDVVIAKLRTAGVRYITLSSDNFITGKFARAHPFWRTLRERYRPNIEGQRLAVFDLDRLIELRPP